MLPLCNNILWYPSPPFLVPSLSSVFLLELFYTQFVKQGQKIHLVLHKGSKLKHRVTCVLKEIIREYKQSQLATILCLPQNVGHAYRNSLGKDFLVEKYPVATATESLLQKANKALIIAAVAQKDRASKPEG